MAPRIKTSQDNPSPCAASPLRFINVPLWNTDKNNSPARHPRSGAAHEGTRHSMKVGYARVSTEDQSLDAQRDQLRADGCSEVFEEKITGKKDSRPALDKALAVLQPGDTLVVWKLDRLGRSVKHLTTLLHDLERRSVCFRSISDGIDTGTPTGKLMFHVLGAIAEFEAALVSERTKIGLQAAKQRGAKLGRPGGWADIRYRKQSICAPAKG